MKMNLMMEEVVGRLLTKSGTVASISSFPGRPPWSTEGLHRPLPSPPQLADSKSAVNFAIKMLPNGIRGLSGGQEPAQGGALAGQTSPPALSPNLPSIVKMEPRLPSPCLTNGSGTNGDLMPFSPSKRSRQEDGTWLPSPSQMSLDSMSPPPGVNGHSAINHNGLSPTSSYDAYCSKVAKVDPLVLLWLNQTRDDDLDKGPGQRVKRRRRTDRSDIDIKKIVKDLLTPSAVSTTTSSGGSSSSSATARKRSVGDESSPEVSSSNISPEPNPVVTTTGISPVPSLAPSDIGEVDLDFWELDINESSNANTIASTSDKDELSPPSSVMNGCYDYDKKKKGPAPRQQEELCLVCGDRASGYHYNALTCEGCKGFFRRSITKNAVYQCKYGNNCEIDMYMRRKCQECRLKKCLSVGMRPECVVPEYQCAIKRETKKAQKDKDKPNSTTRDSGSDKEEKPGSPPNGGQPKAISKAQEELISRLVVFQEEYESPSEEDFKKITAFPLGDSEEDSMKRFQHITEITILTVQLIVEFSKRVPGFDTLSREDQITLLKACSSEVMMLRTARKYDIKTDSIVFANNQPYTRENYRSACMGDSADSIFHFCRNMCVLKVDNAEYALLTAIVIFSERPSLLEPKKVEKIQEFYIETLRAYISTNRPPGKNYFARLLSTLVELRTLGNMNSELCFSLKVQNKKLPAFLEEIWDIQQ